MKKVVALLTTRRKINTYNLLLQVKELLKKHDVDVEILFMFDYKINQCIGCDTCILKGNCVLNDDAKLIMDKISQADGVILASPVYLQQVSGNMKTFLDRTCCWFHRPVLTGKPLLAVSTTKGSGLKATLNYMQNVAKQWGAMNGGCIGRRIFNLKEEVTEKEIKKFVKLLNNPMSYSPSLDEMINFQVQSCLSRKLGDIDQEYFNAKGWYEQNYYVKCKINPIKSVISSSIGKIMQKGMSKAVTVKDVLKQEKEDRKILS